MPKLKKKKKIVIRKKTLKIKTKKRVKILRTKKPQKRKSKDSSPDIIFDSSIGKTDALFISEPDIQPVSSVLPVSQTPNTIDPAIEEALKEFDDLQNAQNKLEVESLEIPDVPEDSKPETKNDQSQNNNSDNAGVSEDQNQKPKKSFWKKLFGFKTHLFSILIGLVFAGVFCAGVYVFASPPSGPYAPGAETNPPCAPGDTNCTVAIPGGWNTTSTYLNNDLYPSADVGSCTCTGGGLGAEYHNSTDCNADANGDGGCTWTATTPNRILLGEVSDDGVSSLQVGDTNEDTVALANGTNAITATGTIEGTTLSDGTCTITGGALSAGCDVSLASGLGSGGGGGGSGPWSTDSNGDASLTSPTYISDGTVESIDPNNRALYSDSGTMVFNYVGDSIVHPDYPTAWAIDGLSNLWAADGASIYSYGTPGVKSIDPNARQLIGSDGSTVALDWSDGTLRDGNGNPIGDGLTADASVTDSTNTLTVANGTQAVATSGSGYTANLSDETNSAAGYFADSNSDKVALANRTDAINVDNGGVVIGGVNPNISGQYGISTWFSGTTSYIAAAEFSAGAYGAGGGVLLGAGDGSYAINVTGNSDFSDVNGDDEVAIAGPNEDLVSNYSDSGNYGISSVQTGGGYTAAGYFIGGYNTSTAKVLLSAGDGSYAINATGPVILNPETMPSSASQGTMYYDSTSGLEVCNASTCTSSGDWSPIGGGADIAENYPTKDTTLSPGEIVALDITNSPFVVRANSLNSSTLLGVVSTAPGFKLGAGNQYVNEIKVPVALAGRVPVKVNLDGGPINIGDRIGLSITTQGMGMKAYAGENTIGIALESFDGSATTTSPATTQGTILVFVQNQQANLNSSGTIGSGQVAGVNGESFLQSVNDSLADLGIAIKNGVASIASLAVDNLNVKTARIQEIEMVASNGDIYCTWIDANGDWQKVKGDCATVGPTVQSVTTAAFSAQPANSSVSSNTSSLGSITSTTSSTTGSIISTTTPTTESVTSTTSSAGSNNSSSCTPSWQCSGFTACANGTQTQTCVDSNNCGVSTNEPVTSQPCSQVLNISSVAPISDINVAYGTSLSSANLPTTVTATLSDATTQSANVTWDGGTPAYDPNTAGTYVFSGTLTFSGN